MQVIAGDVRRPRRESWSRLRGQIDERLGHGTLAVLLRFLLGLFFLHGLGRFLLGFLLDIGAFTHDDRSSRGGLKLDCVRRSSGVRSPVDGIFGDAALKTHFTASVSSLIEVAAPVDIRNAWCRSDTTCRPK